MITDSRKLSRVCKNYKNAEGYYEALKSSLQYVLFHKLLASSRGLKSAESLRREGKYYHRPPKEFVFKERGESRVYLATMIHSFIEKKNSGKLLDADTLEVISADEERRKNVSESFKKLYKDPAYVKKAKSRFRLLRGSKNMIDSMTIPEYCKAHNLNYWCIITRIREGHMSPIEAVSTPTPTGWKPRFYEEGYKKAERPSKIKKEMHIKLSKI